MTDSPRLEEVLAQVLAEHRIDWANAETGVYPCLCGGFAHDTPEGWDAHVAERLAARFEQAFIDVDGRYRYVCEKGHNIVTVQPTLTICSAVLPWPGPGGVACGAEIEYRLFPVSEEAQT